MLIIKMLLCASIFALVVAIQTTDEEVKDAIENPYASF